MALQEREGKGGVVSQKYGSKSTNGKHQVLKFFFAKLGGALRRYRLVNTTAVLFYKLLSIVNL